MIIRSYKGAEGKRNLLATGLDSPVHKVVQPPARIPYATAKTKIPSNECDTIPQSTNVDREVKARVVTPRNQGSILSDVYPIPKRPTTAEPEQRREDSSVGCMEGDYRLRQRLSMLISWH
jgi:hypothetical protein